MAGSCIRLPATRAAAPAPLPTPSPSSSKIFATISSHCSTRRKARNRVRDLSVACRIESRSPFVGNQSSSLYRSQSLEIGNGDRKERQTLQRAVSADFQVFDEDEDFAKKLQELILGGNPSGNNQQNFHIDAMSESIPSTSSNWGLVSPASNQPWQVSGFGPSAIGIPQGGIGNNFDLPASLRIIKQKKKNQKVTNWEEGFWEVGESACCSVNKAFSSMVFMIRELQSYTLYMRQGMFYEDIQDILSSVQQDMHASFVWLFQQIFSGTPTLMVSVMLLLANFTVYSMTASVALAAPLSQPQASAVVVVESNFNQETNLQFDQPAVVKTFSPGKPASVGGCGSGGGNVGPVAGSTDDGPSGPSGPSWNRIVEADNDAYLDYVKTDLHYQLAVQQDPESSLLLTNFAQFLQLVLHDNERAEYYYKKAVAVKPADAEAFSKYANFLWLVKDDIGAAEENYLVAIEADPGNAYHAASYAHFLWNTGGEDTCFPMYA